MYQRFIQELDQTVTTVRTWSNKFRICDDRKKIRDKALNDFNKAYGNYEKKRMSTSQAPGKLEELRKCEQTAKLEFSRLE